MSILDLQLYQAAWGGRVVEVRSLLRDHPNLDVNLGYSGDHWTALHVASREGYVEVVKLLLAHPHIHVNVQNGLGQTPLMNSCNNGQAGVVQLLLKDPRVDVTLDDSNGRTPLWYASCYGHRKVVEWLIASGRELGDFDKKGKPLNGDGTESTALEIAREKNKTEVVTVLKKFMKDPAQIRYELRVKLGFPDVQVAEVFAAMVFLCDDLLQLKAANAPTTSKPKAIAAAASATAATRFFAIAKRLPMELQMILCHRAMNSAKESILSKDSEAAFKALAVILLRSQSK